MDKKCPYCNEDFIGVDSEYKGIVIYICPNMHRIGFDNSPAETSVFEEAV